MDDTLAKDLVAMWQSEITAMAADRELRESWAVFAALWAQYANTAANFLPHDPASRSSGPAQQAGATPLAVAPQPGLGEVERLNLRVAELEQKLAELMAGRSGQAPGGV